MILNIERKKAIHKKTRGRCHLCGARHVLRGHGRDWHVDHSKSRYYGGTDHLNNLFVACIGCNLSKGVSHGKDFRRITGLPRVPRSQRQIDRQNRENAVVGAALGFLAAGLTGKNWRAALIGAGLGFAVGYEIQNE